MLYLDIILFTRKNITKYYYNTEFLESRKISYLYYYLLILFTESRFMDELTSNMNYSL